MAQPMLFFCKGTLMYVQARLVVPEPLVLNIC